MRIYDHPFNNKVTIIEIENSDESREFLTKIIDGFDVYGRAYPSASCGDGEKQVIYVDRRKKSMFNLDETDILCDITVRLAQLDICDKQSDIVNKSISIAEAAGNKQLIERLLVQPPEYFNGFKPVEKAA